MTLEPVIGLEIHVQLKTKSKMFCGCDNSGEDKPINSCVCEICLGHPGTLPVPNKTAIEWTLKAALALNCTIGEESKFDRKHYFYPDLPKGYQISQYDQPFGQGGFLEIHGTKIRLNRLHLEEDAAKLLHPEGKDYTIVDYNRAGTPLMEIVTEPDIHDPRVAHEFLRELRDIMRALDVSNADMEKGHLRCDANVSLREKSEPKKLYPKTEIKNLNSFKAVEHALAYEIKRQTLEWEKTGPPTLQSTRGFDEEKGITIPQRQKEAAHDYRYFPEPDIPPFRISRGDSGPFDINKIGSTLGELPQQKQERFMSQYGFSASDAALLTRDFALAGYSEKVMSELAAWSEALDSESHGNRLAKLAANWIINNLAPLVFHAWNNVPVSPENFAEFISLIAQGKISSRAAQQILHIMVKTSKDPTTVMEEENLSQVHTSDALTEVVDKVMRENQKVVDDYKKGKTNALKFLMGSVMKETKGTANPTVVEKLLVEKLA